MSDDYARRGGARGGEAFSSTELNDEPEIKGSAGLTVVATAPATAENKVGWDERMNWQTAQVVAS